ncbi:hypothetical protein [Vibrio rarus]|uniref:hypothetical protein n=1 Tax=Vibrio rarus TaxID=413403 RepID=UPI0021C3001D|nr:hypothetical protein [Vibrio rarus]
MYSKGFTLVLLSTLMMTGCGPKDEKYDEVAKDTNQVATFDINNLSKTKFIYSHTISQLPSYLNNSLAYDIRRHASVGINLVKDGIELREMPRDLYTAANTQDVKNWPLVLFIPGSYIDYKCQEDSYDKCVNKEVVNSDADVQWYDKHYFIPDFANIQQFTKEKQGTSALFDTCMQQQGGATLVKDGDWNGTEIDLKNGIINFELAKRYTLSDSNACQVFYRNIAGSESGTGNAANGFSTHEFYSIVAKSNLDAKEYTPVPYSHEDFARFGFFDSEIDNLSFISVRSRSQLQNGHRYHDYLYRWNPKREDITYYLSNNYYLPENKPYLDSAKKTITAINIELAEAKTGVPKIILKKQGDKRFGDLRYSFITLDNFADNYNYSGATESITDTQTGEIVSSRIVMNLPMFRSTGVQSRYKVISDTFKFLDGRLDASQLSQELTSGKVTDHPANSMTATSTNASYHSSSDQDSLTETQRSNLATSTKFYNALHGLEMFNSGSSQLSATQATGAGVDAATSNVKQLVPQLPPQLATEKKQIIPKDIQTFWTDNLAPIYGPTSSVWDNPELWTGEPRHSDMLPYAELSDENKSLIQEITGNGFYSGILTHELGHSFGLRHNFRSSVDFAHHFTKKSPFYASVQPKIDKALGVSGEKSMQIITHYSSVMEYMQDSSFYNRIYGAYDLAALRFGYAREIQPDTSNNDVFDVNARWQSVKPHDTSILSAWKKEMVTNPSLGGGAISDSEQMYNMESVRYQFCSDSDIETDFYCNKSDMALTQSNAPTALKNIGWGLVDGVFIPFMYNSVGGNGLSDLSALGKLFDTGDYYTATSSLIKIRHNIARAANAAGIYDADDYLSDTNCPYNPQYSAQGLEQCVPLRASLDATLLRSLSIMDINDIDARVTISQRPVPGVSTSSTPLLVTDVNLNDIYKAATQLHIPYNQGKSKFTSFNSLYTNFMDEQHQSLLFKVLVLNNPTVMQLLQDKGISADEGTLAVNVVPSGNSSVVTPLNGLNFPSDIQPQNGNLYKKFAPAWPMKLELMRDLLRSSDLDPMDHFSNYSMVDYDHKMGRALEVFLCNSVMHTDYSAYHLSTVNSPLTYPIDVPRLQNNCLQSIMQHSDITDEGDLSGSKAQNEAPYFLADNASFSLGSYLANYMRYNILNNYGNDPANKYIEPVIKSDSNQHLYKHFGLAFSDASEEGMTLRINYLKALLKQVVLATDDGVQGGYGHSSAWREYVSVHKDDGLYQGKPLYTYDEATQQYAMLTEWRTSEVYDPDTGKSVYIGPQNILATKLRNRIQDSVVQLFLINKSLAAASQAAVNNNAPTQQNTPQLPNANSPVKQNVPPLPTGSGNSVQQNVPPQPASAGNSVPQNVPPQTAGNTLTQAQQRAMKMENLELQIKRDKHVLFDLLPELD